MNGKWLALVVLALSTAPRSLGKDEFAFLGPLQMAQVVIGTGARAPASTYAKDPFNEESWGAKWGELTQTGKNEQAKLGNYLRARYEDFLPAKYDKDDVLVRCSDRDVAIMSTMVAMEGLYTPCLAPGQFVNVYWQDVPVHTAPEEVDLLLPAHASPCPAFKNELKKVNLSVEYQTFQTQMAQLEQFSQKVCGVSASVLHDSLACKSHHKLPLPLWSEEVFPEPLSTYAAGKMYLSVASTPSSRRMFVGRMVYEILDLIQAKIQGIQEPDRKLYVYGALDANLLALLRALNVWDGNVPPPSSCVLIELRKNSNKQHIVTVSYKNDTTQPPHLLQVPGCRTVACTIPEFVSCLKTEVFNEPECYSQPPVARPMPQPAFYYRVPFGGVSSPLIS